MIGFPHEWAFTFDRRRLDSEESPADHHEGWQGRPAMGCEGIEVPCEQIEHEQRA